MPARSGSRSGVRSSRIRALFALFLAVGALLALTGGPALASASGSTQPKVTLATLNGSGSSWAAPAIDQWSEDVHSQGIVVNYAPNGSQEGRSDFTGDLKDFAGSDIAFLNGQDKIAGGNVETSKYGYSYLPITAGGTAFMYHLTVGGKQVTNLRLSGDTITKIFTGQITNWDDPRITKDYGTQLPSKPIVPVIRSDGSGATAQFTGWMNNQYASQWSAFCAKYGHVNANPCGETEFYPSFGNAKSQGSSTAVASYISAKFGEGAIGYDEYAYALESHYPVVKLENAAGYYVLPTASNDAIALQKAVINFDKTSINYLTEDLTQVYSNIDPRAYPISSYSYLIVPRTSAKPNPSTWSPGKGAAMSSFANYFLCAGQQEMAPLGYSPLPVNLVQGGFNQVAAMPYAQPTPASKNLAACNNPTFKNGKNTLTATAPFPSPCDKVGSPLYNCSTSGGSAGTPATKSPSGVRSDPAASVADAGDGSVDPVTGQRGSSGGISEAGGAPAQTVLVGATSSNRWFPAVAAGLAILAAVALPPSLSIWNRRRRRT